VEAVGLTLAEWCEAEVSGYWYAFGLLGFERVTEKALRNRHWFEGAMAILGCGWASF
jgi:hypothetical protein